MRRWFACVVVVTALVGGLPSPADARVVNGTFAGTGIFEISAPGCPFAHEDFAIELQYGTKRWSLTADVCVAIGTGSSTFDLYGSFDIQTKGRNHIFGTFNATLPFSNTPAPIHADLRVTGGTGWWASATGTLVLDGTLALVEFPRHELSGTLGGSIHAG